MHKQIPPSTNENDQLGLIKIVVWTSLQKKQWLAPFVDPCFKPSTGD